MANDLANINCPGVALKVVGKKRKQTVEWTFISVEHWCTYMFWCLLMSCSFVYVPYSLSPNTWATSQEVLARIIWRETSNKQPIGGKPSYTLVAYLHGEWVTKPWNVRNWKLTSMCSMTRLHLNGRSFGKPWLLWLWMFMAPMAIGVDPY